MGDTERIRVLIVDDEPLGRVVIREMLRAAPDIEIVGECANGHEAIRALNRLETDIVFLDVQMPEIDGFDVLRAIEPDRIPLVIFVTAFDRYAVRAFEVHAVDYLLKPFDRDRFEKALRQARSQLRLIRNGELTARVLALLDDRRGESKYIDRIMVKTAGRIFFLKTADIDWIEAEGNYVRLHAGRETHLVRESLGTLESRLDPRKFPRIHRSQIVNFEKVRELLPLFHGDFQVILENGTTLVLSRRYRERIAGLGGPSAVTEEA